MCDIKGSWYWNRLFSIDATAIRRIMILRFVICGLDSCVVLQYCCLNMLQKLNYMSWVVLNFERFFCWYSILKVKNWKAVITNSCVCWWYSIALSVGFLTLTLDLRVGIFNIFVSMLWIADERFSCLNLYTLLFLMHIHCHLLSCNQRISDVILPD